MVRLDITLKSSANSDNTNVELWFSIGETRIERSKMVRLDIVEIFSNIVGNIVEIFSKFYCWEI